MPFATILSITFHLRRIAFDRRERGKLDNSSRKFGEKLTSGARSTLTSIVLRKLWSSSDRSQCRSCTVSSDEPNVGGKRSLRGLDTIGAYLCNGELNLSPLFIRTPGFDRRIEAITTLDLSANVSFFFWTPFLKLDWCANNLTISYFYFHSTHESWLRLFFFFFLSFWVFKNNERKVFRYNRCLKKNYFLANSENQAFSGDFESKLVFLFVGWPVISSLIASQKSLKKLLKDANEKRH